MKRENIQLAAAVVWFTAALAWLIGAALSGFELLYLAACGLSALAGIIALWARRRDRKKLK